MQIVRIESRLWIEKNGKAFLGAGRVELLENIDSTGSISKAAHSLGMSYKKAWQLVNSINKLAEAPVVIRETGGKNGGGTKLTPEGRKVIAEFKKLEDKARRFCEKEAEKLQSF
ncbi:MAG: LysR family transcriptional regulator [Bacteroidales bacterium]|nr:LysR family transcriptional regulator [Bacteroidales bacterium]MBN2818401.1 LysR family transcriptional regulator [Bacteroidales bacterium]